jgi:tRNA A-37 threonylcarbamoyl transferase component Bud32
VPDKLDLDEASEFDPELELGPKDSRFDPRPLPPRWAELIDQVGLARTRNQFNPKVPLHKIGRFEGIVMLGVGGFGIVFEARDPELDRRVALKLCLTSAPEAAEAIIREAQLLAKLSHPNIVTAHEIGRYGDDVFLVMALVRPKTGESIIAEEPPLSWRKVVEIYCGIGAGLAAAHDAGIVHDDFKPLNVLLDEHYWPRVSDFGLAKLMADHGPDAPDVEKQPGTVAYMAPEKLRGRPGDPLSDQWSYCMSLWQTIEGLLPFGGDTPEDVLTAIDERGAGPRRLTIPDGLRAVLWRGLAAAPSERYPDMHALVRALEGVIRPPPTSRPSGPPASLEPGASSGHGATGDGWRGAFFVVTMLLIGAVVFGALSLRDGVWPRGGGPEAPPRPLAPAPLPASPCALEGSSESEVEIDSSVRGICILIRQGAVAEANSLWLKEHTARELSSIGSPAPSANLIAKRWTTLAAQTVAIARTCVEQAEALQNVDPSAANVAASAALTWAVQANKDLEQVQIITNSGESTVEANAPELIGLNQEIANVHGRALQLVPRIR